MDLWKDAKLTLATVAPLLGTAVGGPLGGTVANIIAGALGLAPDTAPEQVASAVTGATADQLIALRNADHDFAEKMKQLEIDAAKLTYDDKANARAREAAIKDHTPAILAAALTVGYFGFLSLLMFHVLPAGSEEVLKQVISALTTGYTLMLAYYYGASNPTQAK